MSLKVCELIQSKVDSEIIKNGRENQAKILGIQATYGVFKKTEKDERLIINERAMYAHGLILDE